MLLKKLPWIAAVLILLPSLASAQCACGGGGGGNSVMHSRPPADLLWSDYDAPGGHGCGPRCGGCRVGNQGCLPPLRCVIPATARVIGRTFDFLLPCGPRSGHGCGISCIGAGSGCSSCGIGSCGPVFPRWRNICHKQGLGGCSTCGGDYGGEMMGEPSYHHQHETLTPPTPTPAAPTPAAPAQARRSSQPSQQRSMQMAPASRQVTTTTVKRPTYTASAKPSVKVSNASHVSTTRRENSVLKAAAIEETEEEYAPTLRSVSSPSVPRNPLR